MVLFSMTNASASVYCCILLCTYIFALLRSLSVLPAPILFSLQPPLSDVCVTAYLKREKE